MFFKVWKTQRSSQLSLHFRLPVTPQYPPFSGCSHPRQSGDVGSRDTAWVKGVILYFFAFYFLAPRSTLVRFKPLYISNVFLRQNSQYLVFYHHFPRFHWPMELNVSVVYCAFKKFYCKVHILSFTKKFGFTDRSVSQARLEVFSYHLHCYSSSQSWYKEEYLNRNENPNVLHIFLDKVWFIYLQVVLQVHLYIPD